MVQGDLNRLAVLAALPATHVEIGFMEPAALDICLAFVRDLGRTYGFHDPLPFDPRWRWPSMTDPNPAEQARSLGVMSRTLDTAQRHDAVYAPTHFPSVHFEPVNGWSRKAALAAGHEAAGTMARWASERTMRVLLENVGPNPYWDAAAWVDIFQTYPPLGFCLDVGHLHLETGGDHAANLAFVRDLAPYTRQVHLYNATLESYRTYHHVPVHPDQNPSEGWIDVPELLGALGSGRTGPLRIVFEHTPQYPTSESHVADGMQWVRELLGC
jgi:sugar phosphate isomerase/epimerase